MLKKNETNQVLSQVRVPLSYSPKRKYLERIESMDRGEISEKIVAIKLPRMSFEIVAFTYDSQRQLPKTNTIRCGTNIAGDNSRRLKLYSAVPYNIQFQLNIYGKSHDECLQVVEQILPFFSPQYTLSTKPFPNVEGLTDDTPVTLQTVSFSDDYEGSQEQRRTIIYTLDFEMKVNFRGPYDEKGSSIIREVNGEIFNMRTGEKLETVKVVPDPLDAHPDSDYGFSTYIYLYGDSA